MIERVWKLDARIQERTVDVAVQRLRNTLKSACDTELFEAVRGFGYRLTLHFL